MQAAMLYEHLAEPTLRLERWAVKPRRPIGDAELRSLGFGMISDFEQLLAIPTDVEIRVTVSDVDADAAYDGESDDYSEMNTLLDSVRRIRSLVIGSPGESLRRALRARMPELFRTYEDTLAKVLEQIAELEKIFIMYGAGTDDDEAIVAGTVPEPNKDLQPGPSIGFEF
jgi:hypothetical protein